MQKHQFRQLSGRSAPDSYRLPFRPHTHLLLRDTALAKRYSPPLQFTHKLSCKMKMVTEVKQTETVTWRNVDAFCSQICRSTNALAVANNGQRLLIVCNALLMVRSQRSHMNHTRENNSVDRGRQCRERFHPPSITAAGRVGLSEYRTEYYYELTESPRRP